MSISYVHCISLHISVGCVQVNRCILHRILWENRLKPWEHRNLGFSLRSAGRCLEASETWREALNPELVRDLEVDRRETRENKGPHSGPQNGLEMS